MYAKTLYAFQGFPPYAYKTTECDGGIENRALVISSTCGVEYKRGTLSLFLVMHRYRRSNNKPRVKLRIKLLFYLLVAETFIYRVFVKLQSVPGGIKFLWSCRQLVKILHPFFYGKWKARKQNRKK